MFKHGVGLGVLSIVASAMFLLLILPTAVRAASGTQFLYVVGSTNQIYGFSVNSSTGELTPVPHLPAGSTVPLRRSILRASISLWRIIPITTCLFSVSIKRLAR
jgi:hypothetical protein